MVVSPKSFRNLRLHASRGADLVAVDAKRAASTTLRDAPSLQCAALRCAVLRCAASAYRRVQPTFLTHRSLQRQLKYDGFDAKRDYD